MTLAPKITRTQIIAIHSRLKEVLEVLPEGMCRYADSHNDTTIAKEFNCSPNSVAGVRRELFGDMLRKALPAQAPDLEPLRQEMVQLNSRYLQILSALNELIVKHNSLVNTIELNRVAPVKHLAVPRTDLQTPRAS